jgi:hypothetical protein
MNPAFLAGERRKHSPLGDWAGSALFKMVGLSGVEAHVWLATRLHRRCLPQAEVEEPVSHRQLGHLESLG